MSVINLLYVKSFYIYIKRLKLLLITLIRKLLKIQALF